MVKAAQFRAHAVRAFHNSKRLGRENDGVSVVHDIAAETAVGYFGTVLQRLHYFFYKTLIMNISPRQSKAFVSAETGREKEIIHRDDIAVKIHSEQTAQRCFAGSAVSVDRKNKRDIFL